MRLAGFRSRCRLTGGWASRMLGWRVQVPWVELFVAHAWIDERNGVWRKKRILTLQTYTAKGLDHCPSSTIADVQRRG